MVETAIVIPMAILILSLFIDTALYTYNRIAFIDNIQLLTLYASAGDEFDCDESPLMVDPGNPPEGLVFGTSWGGSQSFTVTTSNPGLTGLPVIEVTGTMTSPCMWCRLFDVESTAYSKEEGRGGFCMP